MLFSPLPAAVRALHVYREKISALSSLGRLASVCAYPRYVLSAVDPSCFAKKYIYIGDHFLFANKFKISLDSTSTGPTLLLTVVSEARR